MTNISKYPELTQMTDIQLWWRIHWTSNYPFYRCPRSVLVEGRPYFFKHQQCESPEVVARVEGLQEDCLATCWAHLGDCLQLSWYALLAAQRRMLSRAVNQEAAGLGGLLGNRTQVELAFELLTGGPVWLLGILLRLPTHISIAPERSCRDSWFTRFTLVPAPPGLLSPQ